MSFVLDSSVAMAWVLPDESSSAADSIMSRLAETSAIVPALWPLEIGNVLVMASRRARIDPKKIQDLLAVLYSLPITVEDAPDRDTLMRTLSLAERHGLTAYDAAYLELALRRALPLATFDDRLRSAATVARVVLVP